MTTPNNNTSGLYYDYSIPLGLYNLLQQAIVNNQADPNTPQVAVQRAPREWFSQPAPTVQNVAPQVTVFLVDGSHDMLDVDNEPTIPLPDNPLMSVLSGLLDTSACTIQMIDWPVTQLPMYNSVLIGKQSLMQAVGPLTGPFILVGYSQGAAVVSLVLEEIQSGTMMGYQDQLAAGVTFGNPMRQGGKFAPVQTDPGNSGIWADHQLTNTPSSWWDFALPGDDITAANYGADLGNLEAIFEFAMVNYVGGGDFDQFLLNNQQFLPSTIFQQDAIVIWLIFFLLWFPFGPKTIQQTVITDVAELAEQPHAQYWYAVPPGATKTCPELAAAYINTTARTWQSTYSFVPPTEVLTVNYKVPLSVGQLGFQVLRVPCTVTAWYLDRSNNWIQITDVSNNPISVTVGLSASTSWYSFDTDVYPVVGTAVQLRITRNYDAQMGNKPYVVGIKEMLVRRNVYGLEDTPLAIADQQDVLGNTVSSYVKNWSPPNAIDNDPTTFWKSFPCPDPNGVVSFFLDVRDANGAPQLIDTVYIDPVYTGNDLNLYYSNDPNQGTLVINPCNLPPDVQVNSTWTLGVGMTDTSGVDLAVSQLLFPTSFGPLIEQATWFGIEWLPNFAPGAGPSQNPVLFGVYPNVDTVQLVTLTGNPTGGHFTLAVGIDTTTSIAYDASASTVQTALDALGTVGAGGATVVGDNGGPWQITFTEALAGQNVAAMLATNSLTGGTSPGVVVDVTATGFTPSYLDGSTYWPIVYYDVGAGRIVVEFTNGTTTHTYYVALSPAFSGQKPLQIVVGWNYNPSVVFISVTEGRSVVLGTTTVNPASSLPNKITLDGAAGYQAFAGLMTALVVKTESWSSGQQAFQGNPVVYANPAPVLPDANGNFPSTTLDNAILACDWTAQAMPIGGGDESWYSSKVWTPIYEDYVTEKGNLFLPQKIAMSYLKMEFSNLTAEPYPVYDQGIQVDYDVFPVSVTQAASSGGSGGGRLVSLGAEVVTNSIGSVNWFNPGTIQNAINANWGVTQQPVTVQSGPGTTSASIPNTAQANIQSGYRVESSSPWIYNRQMPNASYLAGQYLTELSQGTSAQGQQNSTVAGAAVATAGGGPSASGSANTTVSNPGANAAQTVSQGFSPVTTTSTSNVTGQMGNDWWLFPGLNLKMNASTMNALTGTSTVTAKGSAKDSTRLRFPTTSVHRYNVTSLTQDAAVAYFAGLAEVQPYVTTYIAGNDPPSFAYNQYDPTTFTYTNINQLATGPLSTQGSPYAFVNPNFEYPLELSSWTPTGPWTWAPSGGLGFSSGQACAQFAADGADGTLISEPIAVSPGDQIIFTAYVAFADAVSSSGGQLSISGVTYEGGTEVGTVAFQMPSTTATYTVATQTDMLATGAVEYDSCTITSAAGGYQGTYIMIGSDPTIFSNWVLNGYGTLVSEPTGNIDGDLFIPLTGTYTVPGSGVDHVALSLDVSSGVTAGTITYATVGMNPADGIEGMVSLSAQTTSSFADLTVNVSDSGLMQSDSMWARLDPLATNIDNLQLAPYVQTIPNVVPAGFWGDSLATWDDPGIDWGEPYAEVAITLDPNLIFDGNRAVHFTRAAGAGEAGIVITQQTNMMAQELAQLGCVFYKPTANDNQITVRLRRVSDGVYIHEETFTPIAGYWYTYQGQFFELPDGTDQVYAIEFVLTGDDADEIYLSNLYTNLAGIRYLVQLGDSGAFQFDVTPLVYADNANVSTTLPVNQFNLTVGVFNPTCFAYGVALTPRYLK